ncbi:DNA-directed RNA polymerase beta chain [Streptococcus equi subsp. equi]|uniref:DNA-directed RNA polymerase beta chain n=1 Tax=Streptococcus equi subsp. equi TaxID=148942 RepID=A0A380KRV1_9STRE|nr:DNA-directed RNA polymerase beta chain [Streptococcus equi subsp. equi]
MAFIQTPYRKVDRVIGRVTNEIVWLTADEEDELQWLRLILSSIQTVPLLKILSWDVTKVITKKFLASQVDFVDVSPKQVVAVATSLYSFP